MNSDFSHNKHREDAPASFDHLKDQNPFEVPEGYFEAFPSEVMNRINSEKVQPAVRHNRRIWGATAAVAAALAGCLLLFYLIIPGKNTRETGLQTSYADYTPAILDYLQNDTEVDEQTLIDLIAESPDANALMQNTLSVPIPDDSIQGVQNSKNPMVLDTTISSDDILQYLIDEGIDPNS